MIFWLFCEEGFQFSTGLLPAFVGGNVIAGNILKPSLTKISVRLCKNRALRQD